MPRNGSVVGFSVALSEAGTAGSIAVRPRIDNSPSGEVLTLTALAGSITAFADGGGGQVVVTSASHLMVNGSSVTVSGTTSYNGTFTVSNVTTNTFEITDTWVSNDATGTWVQSSPITSYDNYTKLRYGFSAGECIAAQYTTDASWAPSTVDVTITLFVEFHNDYTVSS